jgi:Ca2+-binding EF-hand superfamily protein
LQIRFDRRLIAQRPAVQMSTQVGEELGTLIEGLDQDGDGEVDLVEWAENMTPGLRQALARMGPTVYHIRAHLEAARRGQQAVEVDLFRQYDVDHSGSLSKKEIRRALAPLRKERPGIPGMEDVLRMLDADDLLEVDLFEWQQRMPADFRDAIRARGPEVLRTQVSVSHACQAGSASFSRANARAEEHAEFLAKVAFKKKSVAAYSTDAHAKAAAQGETAVEVDLFLAFDADGGGALDNRELRRMLALIRTKFGTGAGQPPIPGLQEMLAKLDADGDGEVTLQEWGERMPAAFRKALRAMGDDLLRAAGDTRAGTGTGTGGTGRLGGAGERAKEAAEYEARRREAKRSAAAYSADVHARAAAKGERAVEVDLFLMFDADGSGSLGRAEFRRMLAVARTKYAHFSEGRQIPGVDALKARMDADGDGEVSLREWGENMPADFRGAVRALGPALLDQVAGDKVSKSVGARPLAPRPPPLPRPRPRARSPGPGPGPGPSPRA